MFAMNTEAKTSFRKDALVATIAIGVLGLVWIVFRLYWQGLLLLLAAGLVAYLSVWRSKAEAQGQAEAEAQAHAGPGRKRARADGPRRGKGKKRKRRK